MKVPSDGWLRSFARDAHDVQTASARVRRIRGGRAAPWSVGEIARRRRCAGGQGGAGNAAPKRSRDRVLVTRGSIRADSRGCPWSSEPPTGAWTSRLACTTRHQRAACSSISRIKAGDSFGSTSLTVSSATPYRNSTASPAHGIAVGPVSDPRGDHDGGRFRTTSSEGRHLAGGASRQVLPPRIAREPPTEDDGSVALVTGCLAEGRSRER
jgi:hypothetical protein